MSQQLDYIQTFQFIHQMKPDYYYANITTSSSKMMMTILWLSILSNMKSVTILHNIITWQYNLIKSKKHKSLNISPMMNSERVETIISYKNWPMTHEQRKNRQKAMVIELGNMAQGSKTTNTPGTNHPFYWTVMLKNIPADTWPYCSGLQTAKTWPKQS